MPKIMVPSPQPPTKVVLRKMARKHTIRAHATVRNCLYARCDSFFSLGPFKEAAMTEQLSILPNHNMG